MLFDLDGTLVDHDSAAREGVIRWLTGEGLATEEQCAGGLIDMWDELVEKHFPAFLDGEISFQDQRRRRLRDFLPNLGLRAGTWRDEELDRTFAIYLQHYEASWRAFDDVLPCLDVLTGVRLAVLSNGDQAQQEAKLLRSGLDLHFEMVMTSGLLGAAKPQPGAFLLACERLAVDPRAATYVGDRLDVDAEAATAAGLRGVWLDRQRLGTERRVTTIRSLRELPTLLGSYR